MADKASWQYEVESVQRGGVTAVVTAKRYGKEWRPKASDDHETEESEAEAFDRDGIPSGI